MAGSSSINDVYNVLANLAQSLVPVQKLIVGIAYVIGLAFAVKAIYSLKVYGEARTMMASHASLKEPLTYLAVAAIFIYFPTGLSIMLATTFGTSNIMQYAPSDSNGFDISFIDNSSLALLIQTIGAIAFVRGWVLIARAAGQGQQPGGTAKGLMHIFGGILAINIVLTLQIINNTLYGTT